MGRAIAKFFIPIIMLSLILTDRVFDWPLYEAHDSLENSLLVFFPIIILDYLWSLRKSRL